MNLIKSVLNSIRKTFITFIVLFVLLVLALIVTLNQLIFNLNR